MNGKKFIARDISLAATLVLLGRPHIGMVEDQERRGRFHFEFEDTEGLRQVFRDFQAGGILKVDPRAFAEMVRNLMAEIKEERNRRE